MAFWLALGYGCLGLGTFALDSWARGLALNSLNTVVFFHAGLLGLARSRREAIARWGWRVFAFGLFAQAINQGWASLYMLRFKDPPPFPDWADLLSYLSLILIIATLLAWPLASASGSERIRKGLDGLGAALSALFWAWCIALGPFFHRSDSSNLERLAQVVFFIGNATILGICAYLGARQASRFRGPLGWITIGFSASALEVTLQVPLALAGKYHLGHPLDLLVLLAALFIMLAPLSPVPLEPIGQPGIEARDPARSALFLPLLPAASALVVILVCLLWRPGYLDATLIGLGALMALLGLLRGLLALKDLQALSSNLEARVEERTKALEAMQDAMIRTERLNAMAVLGAGLAHDLNNTLATVRAYAELARDRVNEGQLPHIKDLDHILVAADQSATLTQRLMSFGRMEEETPSVLCLRDELARLETILRMLLRRDIALRMDLGEGSVLIQGARAQIEQIFVNLVANARDAMPHGGTIAIRLSVDSAQDHPLARVVVEDSGHGMTPDIQEKIFQPFFTTKEPGKGTGLGLASVRQLLHDLGGTLAVASQPEVGTTFVLRIPRIDT
jgi:signal transduction histidine kinase